MILVQQTVRTYHRFMLLTINFRDECTNIAKIDGIVSDIIIQLTRSLLTITESCIQMCCRGLMMKYLVQFACENGVSFKKKIFKLRNDTAGTRPGLGTTYRLSRSFFSPPSWVCTAEIAGTTAVVLFFIFHNHDLIFTGLLMLMVFEGTTISDLACQFIHS